MTNEKINIAIAKACGWRQSKSPMWEGFWHDKRKRTYQRFCPDFRKDLNAMHEAEKLFDQLEKEIYWNNLYDQCDRTVFSRVEDNFIMLHATARQRAEAFLKTIGKWEGGSDECR